MSDKRKKRAKCECAEELARFLYEKAQKEGACLPEEWDEVEDEDDPIRDSFRAEAAGALEWVGNCRCDASAAP